MAPLLLRRRQSRSRLPPPRRGDKSSSTVLPTRLPRLSALSRAALIHWIRLTRRVEVPELSLCGLAGARECKESVPYHSLKCHDLYGQFQDPIPNHLYSERHRWRLHRDHIDG